jgi:2-haloalkanoic acid dehalogenase type II
MIAPAGQRRYDAVIFDLLSALLDSWTLWNDVAGGEETGMRWRGAYLRHTYAAHNYRPYETLVAEAAEQVGLPARLADELTARWGELQPWPEASATLRELAEIVPLATVTNCSETLGHQAAARVDAPFTVVVTAERAGYYKPDPHPYQLALAELGVPPERALFIAGSPFDVPGATAVGMPTIWHNRLSLTLPPDSPRPLAIFDTLRPLPGAVAPDAQ